MIVGANQTEILAAALRGLEAQRKAAELSPQSTEAHFNLGMALAQDGRHEAAEDAYGHAIHL